MTCRNEISAMFGEKPRSDLLDYVCNRIDEDEIEIEEMWNCIGKLLAYIETKDFSQTFENVTNEIYIKNKIKEMLKIKKWYCIEHYKENWKSKLESQE